jgi:hypothetical protein
VKAADVFEVVTLDAAKVVTIGQDAKGVWAQAKCPKLGKGFAGTFVRIDPPKTASSERIREVEAAAKAAGAAAVKVLRQRESATVTEAKAVEPSRSARETVMAMADESRSRDHDALRETLGRLLDAEGV